MTQVHTEITTDRATADTLIAARVDLLTEHEISPGRFIQTEGPFEDYERLVQVSEHSVGTVKVVERTDFRMAVPIWRPLMHMLMKRALAETDRTPHQRWWWPAEVVSTRTTTLISLLAVLAILAGYLGTIISQTITFASKEFGASDTSQADTLAAIRIGVLVALVFLRRADRIGRRPLIIGFMAGAILFTVAGAFSGSLVTLGITQGVARGLTTGLATLVTLAASEEVPATMRTFILSVLVAFAALGSGMVLWILPLADTGPGGWRIIYVVPAVFLPVLWWLAKLLPETRRFQAATSVRSPDEVNRKRLLMLLVTFFMLLLFASPASQLQNEYLRDDLGMTATNISFFRLVVSLPAGAAILIAGYLADRRGRRHIATFGVLGGTIASAMVYRSDGAALWLFATVGVLFLGAAVPTMRGYQAELFPTRSRARIGAWLDVIGVAGSALGLVLVGRLADRIGGLGVAIPLLLIGPVISAFLLFFVFPETASKELEHFNPNDPKV
jgi:MFS family permease